MPHVPHLNGVYVDLDALMDTRLGTLVELDDSLLEHVMKNGYTSRDEDVFPDVPKELYRELYKKRDTQTLLYSIKTKMLEYLKETIQAMRKVLPLEAYGSKVDITINAYPFTLTPEQRQTYAELITDALGPLVNVQVIYAGPELFTPTYCKSNYSLIIKYEYADWLEYHAHAFQKHPIPDVTLFVPDIWFKDKPSADVIEKTTVESMHPMEAMEFASAPFICLKLISVAYYCADIFPTESAAL